MYWIHCLLWQRWRETALRQETDYGHWRAKYVTEVSVKNVASLWGHAANFSANPISTGGGLSFASQPETSLICSCCDFMQHGLKDKHTWPMIYGAWQPKLLPVGVNAHTFVAVCCLCLDDIELINSGKKTLLQNIWMCWQHEGSEWTLTEWPVKRTI